MKSHGHLRRISLIGTILATVLNGCWSTKRAPQADETLLKRRNEYVQGYLDETGVRYTALLQRNKAQLDEFNAGRRATPPVIDYLIITGGGDVGAFGAGFLKGWSAVPKSDPLARPRRFDVVTGVSTGALIAPFAWIGDAESDQKIVDLYRNPGTDWVKERWPLYFLPNHLSFAEVPGLERQCRETYSREMITKITDPAEAGRLLFVNTTNLDDGSPRVFYMVPEAHRAIENNDLSRFHNILLASSGIPGAFPYREIDGAMYVDGAVSSNMIFGGRLPEDQRLVGLWAKLYPDVPMPKLRYWVIFNNQVHTPPAVVPARWLDIIMRSVEVSSRSSSLNALRQLFMLTDIAKMRYKADVEVRYIAVPDEWRPPKPGVFIKETMNNLADLGEKMGRDPSSWLSEPPVQ